MPGPRRSRATTLPTAAAACGLASLVLLSLHPASRLTAAPAARVRQPRVATTTLGPFLSRAGPRRIPGNVASARRDCAAGVAAPGAARHVAPTGKPGQVLEEGDTVLLMGSLDAVGRSLITKLQDSGKYKISTLLNPNVVKPFQNRYASINCVDATKAEEAKAELGKAAMVIMAFEKPADTDTLRYLLGYGAEGETALKRFVLLSKTGVTRKGNFGGGFLKNLFTKELDKYYDLEDLLQKGAEALKVDFTVVRSGNLRLGPDTYMIADSLAAAEEQLFDAKFKNIAVSAEDSEDGDTSRYDVADALYEAMLRPEAANKIFSVLNKEGKEKPDWDTLYKSSF